MYTQKRESILKTVIAPKETDYIRYSGLKQMYLTICQYTDAYSGRYKLPYIKDLAKKLATEISNPDEQVLRILDFLVNEAKVIKKHTCLVIGAGGLLVAEDIFACAFRPDIYEQGFRQYDALSYQNIVIRFKTRKPFDSLRKLERFLENKMMENLQKDRKKNTFSWSYAGGYLTNEDVYSFQSILDGSDEQKLETSSILKKRIWPRILDSNKAGNKLVYYLDCPSWLKDYGVSPVTLYRNPQEILTRYRWLCHQLVTTIVPHWQQVDYDQGFMTLYSQAQETNYYEDFAYLSLELIKKIIASGSRDIFPDLQIAFEILRLSCLGRKTVQSRYKRVDITSVLTDEKGSLFLPKRLKEISYDKMDHNEETGKLFVDVLQQLPIHQLNEFEKKEKIVWLQKKAKQVDGLFVVIGREAEIKITDAIKDFLTEYDYLGLTTTGIAIHAEARFEYEAKLKLISLLSSDKEIDQIEILYQYSQIPIAKLLRDENFRFNLEKAGVITTQYPKDIEGRFGKQSYLVWYAIHVDCVRQAIAEADASEYLILVKMLHLSMYRQDTAEHLIANWQKKSKHLFKLMNLSERLAYWLLSLLGNNEKKKMLIGDILQRLIRDKASQIQSIAARQGSSKQKNQKKSGSFRFDSLLVSDNYQKAARDTKQSENQNMAAGFFSKTDIKGNPSNAPISEKDIIVNDWKGNQKPNQSDNSGGENENTNDRSDYSPSAKTSLKTNSKSASKLKQPLSLQKGKPPIKTAIKPSIKPSNVETSGKTLAKTTVGAFFSKKSENGQKTEKKRIRQRESKNQPMVVADSEVKVFIEAMEDYWQSMLRHSSSKDFKNIPILPLTIRKLASLSGISSLNLAEFIKKHQSSWDSNIFTSDLNASNFDSICIPLKLIKQKNFVNDLIRLYEKIFQFERKLPLPSQERVDIAMQMLKILESNRIRKAMVK